MVATLRINSKQLPNRMLNILKSLPVSSSRKDYVSKRFYMETLGKRKLSVSFNQSYRERQDLGSSSQPKCTRSKEYSNLFD